MLLEVVVTARPSWARVTSLLSHYKDLMGKENVRLSLVGPALSERYGDLSQKIPAWLRTFRYPTLGDSDDLGTIAISCFNGATSLARHWEDYPRPDSILVVADRTETLGVAAAACLMQIPLIHLQGGEVSGSIDNKIRDINSKMADLHLTTNFKTKLRLQSIGEDSSRIFIVGCPSIDLVLEVMKYPKTINNSLALGGVGAQFDLKDNYGIILFHPDTLNEKDNLLWTKSIIELVKKSDINWLWFWPNPDFGTSIISKLIREVRERTVLNKVRFIKNLSPDIFISVASTASIVVGNSSFGIRESSFIGIPVINLGKRQNGRERAENVTNIETYTNENEIMDAFEKHMEIGRFKRSEIYGKGNAGEKAAQILKNWTPVIKNTL